MKGCEILRKYNLLNESWISVIEDETLKNKKVSLIEIFENTEKYKDLAGDTKTQDFAITRLLLAVLQTVFSRFNYEGDPHPGIELDEKLRQVEDVDEDYLDNDEYKNSLQETWKRLWESKKFPEIVSKYLSIWEDHFYFLDDKYPFYQVRKEEIEGKNINKANPSSVSGKNINRMISESGNKVALFSPKYDKGKNKEILKEDEALRWLITFQSYSGLSDKVIFGKEKYEVPNSKGWLFDIGGIYIAGNNLFDTLLLNLILPNPIQEYIGKIERPCWEFDSSEIILNYLSYRDPDNLAELYTNWSRAIYIDSEKDFNEAFEFEIVKIPEINHLDAFLEPMTLWRLDSNGPEKDKFKPKKHNSGESLWRSFGLITNLNTDDKEVRTPGIIEFNNSIKKVISEYNLIIKSISMKDDGNATSWVPVDEIYDSLAINEEVLTDIDKKGWVPLIDAEVELAKKAVGGIYGYFISDLMTVRNDKSKVFKKQKVEELYYKLNEPFKDWIASINKKDEKNKKVREWRDKLKSLVINEAREIVSQANTRDYRGIEKEGKIMNIATVYNKFINILNKNLRIGGENDKGK